MNKRKFIVNFCSFMAICCFMFAITGITNIWAILFAVFAAIAIAAQYS